LHKYEAVTENVFPRVGDGVGDGVIRLENGFTGAAFYLLLQTAICSCEK
jgi:hypothetical protein